jgi:hypothetical protein
MKVSTKKRSVLLLPVCAVLWTVVFIFAGCPTDDGGDPNPGGNGGITKTSLPGNFGSGGKFAAAKPAARSSVIGSRSISSENTVQITGKLSCEGKVYDLKGFYDNEDGNFSLSALTADSGVEITGNTGNGGKAVIKTKNASTNEGTVVSFEVSWHDLQIEFPTTESAATAFPESWQGMYDFSLQAGQNNGGGVESWFSINSAEERGRFVMVMGPYSMDFWANLDLLRGDVEAGNPDWTPAQVDEQLVQLSKAQSSFTILEITKKTDDKYEALLVFTVPSDSAYITEFTDDNSTETADKPTGWCSLRNWRIT